MEQKLTEAEHSRSQLRRVCTKFCTPVFLEAFVLTFLAGVCCAGHTQQSAGCHAPVLTYIQRKFNTCADHFALVLALL